MAEIRKIICAVDFAEFSPQVADYAGTLAKAFQGEIHVLYIVPTMSQYVGLQVAPSSIENFVGEIISGAEETMNKFIQDHFSDVSVQGKVITGYAAEEILRYADEQNMDLLVMGTHGRKGIDRILFGSVAERVVKSSPIPVLTLRPKQS
ncbi:MAG: universal stress protein [Desulfohalobiaceae bacterium]|nr:universal stress protein [Desulfohalobiaceae bacterium]